MIEASPDQKYMARAFELAELGRGRVEPNPMVGAVIVKDGEIVGEGYHEYFGGPHAEVNAIKVAGENSRAATIYVTLEPCNHFGKTPPCTNAIFNAGIAEVVYAVADENPAAAGGAAKLTSMGIRIRQLNLRRENSIL